MVPVKWNSKLFDDKVALDDKYHWDGVRGGAAWREKVRGYIIGCCPPLKPLLDWAEAKDCHPISEIDVTAICMQQGWLSGEDPLTISGHLWRFLKMITDGEAKKVFIAAKPELHGLEGWRALTWEVTRGRQSRMTSLGDQLRAPPQVRAYQDVSAAIASFDAILDEYGLCGGTVPPALELKQSLLKALPQDLRENLILKASEPDSYEAFKMHVRTKVAFILDCRGTPSRNANLCETSPAENLAAQVNFADIGGDEYPDEMREELRSS